MAPTRKLHFVPLPAAVADPKMLSGNSWIINKSTLSDARSLISRIRVDPVAQIIGTVSWRVSRNSVAMSQQKRSKRVNNIATVIIGTATSEHDFPAIYPKLAESSNEFHLRGYMRSGDYSRGLRGCVEIERLVRRHQELHRGSHRLATYARLTLLRFMYLSQRSMEGLKRSWHRNAHTWDATVHEDAVIIGRSWTEPRWIKTWSYRDDGTPATAAVTFLGCQGQALGVCIAHGNRWELSS